LSKLVGCVSMLWLVANGQSDQCPDLGTTPLRNSGTNNFAIDTFTDLPFAYAINQCTVYSLLEPNKFIKYTCEENEVDSTYTVHKLEYSTSACSGTGTSLGSWMQDDALKGEEGYFECTGMDYYAKVAIGTAADCSDAQTVYAGLGACVDNEGMTSHTQISVYCDTEKAHMEFYAYANNMTFCPDATYCTKWVFTSSCAQIAQVPVAGAAVTIYGKLLECSNGVTTSTTMAPSSARGQFVLANIIFAVMSLVWFY